MSARCRIQSCVQPPSTGSSAPVVKVASNARKRTALAISSGVPQRFMGTMPFICSCILAILSLSMPILLRIGVSVGPGDTALTRMSLREKVRGEHTGEGPQRSLGGGVGGVAGHPLYIRDRGREDD